MRLLVLPRYLYLYDHDNVLVVPSTRTSVCYVNPGYSDPNTSPFIRWAGLIALVSLYHGEYLVEYTHARSNSIAANAYNSLGASAVIHD